MMECTPTESCSDFAEGTCHLSDLNPNPWTKGISPLAVEASPTRSLSLSTLPSDSGSSFVKEGTPEEMDVDVETIDAVDEAIAAIKEYKDRVPEEDYSLQRWIYIVNRLFHSR